MLERNEARRVTYNESVVSGGLGRPKSAQKQEPPQHFGLHDLSSFLSKPSLHAPRTLGLSLGSLILPWSLGWSPLHRAAQSTCSGLLQFLFTLRGRAQSRKQSETRPTRERVEATTQ